MPIVHNEPPELMEYNPPTDYSVWTRRFEFQIAFRQSAKSSKAMETSGEIICNSLGIFPLFDRTLGAEWIPFDGGWVLEKGMETESKGTLNGTIREVIYWFAFDTKYSMGKWPEPLWYISFNLNQIIWFGLVLDCLRWLEMNCLPNERELPK